MLPQCQIGGEQGTQLEKQTERWIDRKVRINCMKDGQHKGVVPGKTALSDDFTHSRAAGIFWHIDKRKPHSVCSPGLNGVCTQAVAAGRCPAARLNHLRTGH